MTNILVSSFDAFGGLGANPSDVLRLELAERDASLKTVCLPTSYACAWAVLRDSLERHHPSHCLMFGYAQSTTVSLRLERSATNADRAPSADNDGSVLSGQIVSSGPKTLHTGVDVDALATQLRAQGHQVAVSDDAGGFVCNHLYYQSLEIGRREFPACTFLFVHVGGLPVAAGTIAAANELLRLTRIDQQGVRED
ncbi:MAG: hypothetical protein JO246_05400 [Frankiaceae bacterium]|nr:hypothetical protein [Frankiaceae bacterium]MBV9869676.1 hypothetical protein [Frankiaceae bacterium]